MSYAIQTRDGGGWIELGREPSLPLALRAAARIALANVRLRVVRADGTAMTVESKPLSAKRHALAVPSRSEHREATAIRAAKMRAGP